ncbi:unnamed protein product [Bursaphelenchus okinawaensis]|uniref:Peptidase A1 domain-containing protein n=1 Tax=Bursaphelenchus okinawaensis TaxID=465554 RepID=A0A811KM12_9BILA|nr:unnamed protein product [Bursaphelenchus okinawaensis]CAG9106097.1 unnamed protein product [Bursaphelenchus okinawaensis]
MIMVKDALNFELSFGAAIFTDNILPNAGIVGLSLHNQNGGRIVFGGEDTSNCEKVTNWIDVKENSGYWEFVADSVKIGNMTRFNVTVGSDTVSNGMIIPQDVADHLVDKLYATYLYNSFYSPYTYVVMDNVKLDMGLVIDNVTYSFDIKNFLEHFPINMELIKLRAKMNGLPTTLNLKNNTDVEDRWIFGAGLFKAFCHVYDIQNQRIALANVKQSTQKGY